MTPSERAKQMLDMEVFYWGDKGLETTQRCSQKTALVRQELERIGSDQVDYWNEVNKEIYKQGK